MEVLDTLRKRVVVVYWKNRQNDPFEVFSSLKNFCLSYVQYNYNTLSNYLGKEKIAYDNEQVRIERKIVFLKPKADILQRKILPVVRKVALKDADDYTRDTAYWLSRPDSERLAAVTFLIRQTMKKGQRMDKTKIVKRRVNT